MKAIFICFCLFSEASSVSRSSFSQTVASRWFLEDVRRPFWTPSDFQVKKTIRKNEKKESQMDTFLVPLASYGSLGCSLEDPRNQNDVLQASEGDFVDVLETY